MGCVQSTAESPTSANKGAALTPAPAAPRKDEMPSYMTADPDLGWRNITEPSQSYPTTGFQVDFQNERSGNLLKRQDLLILSVNIAQRAAQLANRYGVTDSEGFQSSSNLLEDLARQQGDKGEADDGNTWGPNVDKDMRKVLKQFGCPHFGWQLKSRKFPTGPLIKENPEIFLTGDAPPPGNDSRDDVGNADGGAMLTALAAVPPFLQEITDGAKKRYLLDIPEIAINIAEQLFRLEKSEDAGHRIPNKFFGWKILETSGSQVNTAAGPQPRESFAIPVATPEGEALMVIPEELVMHVASWVQQTYLTAPAF